MMESSKLRGLRLAALAGITIALMSSAGAAVAALARGDSAADTNSAASLRARYTQYQAQLAQNPYGRPLHLVSQEGDSTLRGDVYAVVDHPFGRVDAGLAEAASWCDVLILPYNTKGCTASPEGNGQMLSLFIGKKDQDSTDRAYRLDFTFFPVARTADYLKRVLKSESGPMGTRDYDITLEAAPLDETHTFLHLGYSYGYGTLGKLAMQTYLGTFGASKVGFSSEGRDAAGKPQLVGGMRGVMERNTMRYFLAIQAYLDSLLAPAQARLDKRLNDWFTLAEKYPRQLHEMERGEYIAQKQRQARRPKG